MTPFIKAVVPPEEIEVHLASLLQEWKDGDEDIRRSFKATSIAEAEKEIREWMEGEAAHDVYLNDTYQVQVRRNNGDESGVQHVWLSIKRIDRESIHDWRDLQEIKNQLVGPECEFVELYPAESRKTDTANQYHLWGTDSTTLRLPFGFNQRMVTDKPIGKSKQRPFNV